MALNQIVLCKAEQAATLEDRRLNRLVNTAVGLFTNNVTITRDTLLTDLTEATWKGYVQYVEHNWTGSAEQGDGIHAVTQNVDVVTFYNNENFDVTFYGVFLVTTGGEFVGAANVGAVSLPSKGSLNLTIQVTERAEYVSSP
jgi:hypothetical protein